ncbi:hypothetical protein HOD08_02200, partial [bacterium]|nr:hypothetical protein [bacterium]
MKKTVAKILVVLIPAMSLPQLSFGSTEKNTSPTESDSYLVQRHLEEKEIRRPENFAQAIAAALELFNLATSELDKFIGKHTGEIGVVNTLPFNRMLICQEVLERLTAIEENIGRYLSEKSTPLSQIKLIRNKIELIDPYAGIRSATSKRLKADLKKLHTSIVATDKKMIKEAERKAGNCKSISTQTKVLLGTGAAVVVVATIAGIACKVKKVGPFRSPSKTEAQQIAYENKIEKVVLDSKLKTQEMQTQHQEELQRARNGYERETLKHFVSTLETQQKAQQAEAASQFKSALESLKTSGTQQDEKINKLQMQYDQQVKTIDEKHATLIAANQSAMQSQKLADEKTLQDVIDANKKTATELTSQQATGMTQMQKTLDGKLTQAGKQQLKELMTQQTQAQKDGLSTLLHENKTLENQLTNQQTLHNQQVQKSLDLQLAAATEKQEALKEFVTETCRTLSDETKAALAQHDGNLVQFTTQQQAAIAEHKELTQQQQQAAATQLKDILVLQAQTQNAGLSAMQLQQDTLATQLTDQQTAYMTAMQKTLDGKLTQAGKEQLKEILTQQKEKLDAGLQTLQKANQQHRMQMKQAVTDQLTN